MGTSYQSLSLQSLKHCGIAVTELTEFARLLAPATPYDRRELGMADPTSTFDWTLHIVLACITCERVILFTRPNKDLKVAHEASRAFMRLIPADPNTQKTVDGIVNLFLPTVCSSCDTSASWTSLSISRSFMETWQPYLAMRAFLEGDLSMIGSSICLVHRAEVMEIAGSDYIIQSVTVNPRPETAAEVQLYLQSGVL